MSEQNFDLGHCFVCQNLMKKKCWDSIEEKSAQKYAEVGKINIKSRIKKRTNQRSCKFPRI